MHQIQSILHNLTVKKMPKKKTKYIVLNFWIEHVKKIAIVYKTNDWLIGVMI